MKLKNGYLLHEIAGVPYLLPYGQNIADHRRSMRFNEASLLLFQTLEKLALHFQDQPNIQQEKIEQELLSVLLTHYQADASAKPSFLEDIRRFLWQLHAIGLLTDFTPKVPMPADVCFRIGSLTLGYRGPKDLIHPSFRDFSCGSCQPDQTIHIIPAAPAIHANGEILIRTKELAICKNESSYLFFYPADYGIAEVHLSLDGSAAEFYCPSPFCGDLSEKLFHAIRFTYLVKAQMQGLYAIHSASICYRDMAWLFSAPAGIGKSTHTAIWNRLYQTPFLNGDLNLLGIKDGIPVVYGIPWCGTSGHYTTETKPLGGIAFLKRAPFDQAHLLTKEAAQLHTIQRLISPSWTKDMLLSNLDFAAKLAEQIPLFLLECTAEDSAAIAIKREIDQMY